MRRALPALLLLALPVLASCGSDGDARFESTGGGYGFPDISAGQLLTVAAISACVTEGSSAEILHVQLEGASMPAVESFSVEVLGPDESEARIQASREATSNGSTTIDQACPDDADQLPPETPRLVINARMPKMRTDVNSVEVIYEIDGSRRSTSVPLDISMCPPGESGPNKDCTSDYDE